MQFSIPKRPPHRVFVGTHFQKPGTGSLGFLPVQCFGGDDGRKQFFSIVQVTWANCSELTLEQLPPERMKSLGFALPRIDTCGSLEGVTGSYGHNIQQNPRLVPGRAYLWGWGNL